MTVRRGFYQATVRHLHEKSEDGYREAQTDLRFLLRLGILRYDWLADNTRWQRKPRTYDGVDDALAATARFFYRKSLWAHADSKKTDSRAKNFAADSVELDAIEPNHLRSVVREAIERHLPADEHSVLKAAEESERSILYDIVGRLRGGVP
jgi:hypothetical protein